MDSIDNNESSAKKSPWKFLLVAVTLGLMGLILYLTESGDCQSIRAAIASHPYLQSRLMAILLAFMVTTVFLPSAPAAIILGVAFGATEGTILLCIGSLLSAAFSYGLSKFYLSDYINERYQSSTAFNKLKKNTDKYGAWYIFVYRVFGAAPAGIGSYFAGTLRIAFIPFLLATLIGQVPIKLMWTMAGSSAGCSALASRDN